MEDALDDEWENFINNGGTQDDKPSIKLADSNGSAPECDDLYISTQTKVLFLNQKIDIN